MLQRPMLQRLSAEFATAIGADGVRTDHADLAPHCTDWRGVKTGHADFLLLPRSTADVAALVRVALSNGVLLVPQGGNTGLVGGSVPEPAASGPVAIVSTRRLNRIRQIDAEGLSLVAEAGAILSDVHAAADAAGVRFPLSLGARGSATMGGLASTNAGGTQVLRHGTMRGLVLGLEAVLPDGAVLDQLGPLRKDNSGYDVKQLLLGAEGTLGIITAVAVRLAPAMAERSVAWVGVGTPHAALALLAMLRQALGERVESFEMVAADALALVLQHVAGTRAPLGDAHPLNLLIEVEADDSRLEALLAAALEQGLAADAIIARSDTQAAMLWKLREDVPEAERIDGPALKNDISIPVAAVPDFHDAVISSFAQHYPGCRPLVFGHLGDGNLHLNLRPPAGLSTADRRAWLEQQGEGARRLLHDLITASHGSISAEHGIGTLKAAELARLGNPAKLAAMMAIKQALDPAGIMNPGKILATGGPAR